MQICATKLEMMSEKEVGVGASKGANWSHLHGILQATLLFLHFTNADPWSGSAGDAVIEPSVR